MLTVCDQYCSNQLKVFHQDGRGLRTIDLPKFAENNSLSLSPNAPTDKPLDESLDGMKLSESNGNISGKFSKSFHHNHHHARGAETQPVKLDEKVLHLAWHPFDNTVAVAGKSGLCLYKV